MDLQWSPKRSDHLVIWSQDITLYQIEECGGDEALRQGCKSLAFVALKIETVNEYDYMTYYNIWSIR